VADGLGRVVGRGEREGGGLGRVFSLSVGLRV